MLTSWAIDVIEKTPEKPSIFMFFVIWRLIEAGLEALLAWVSGLGCWCGLHAHQPFFQTQPRRTFGFEGADLTRKIGFARKKWNDSFQALFPTRWLRFWTRNPLAVRYDQRDRNQIATFRIFGTSRRGSSSKWMCLTFDSTKIFKSESKELQKFSSFSLQIYPTKISRNLKNKVQLQGTSQHKKGSQTTEFNKVRTFIKAIIENTTRKSMVFIHLFQKFNHRRPRQGSVSTSCEKPVN